MYKLVEELKLFRLRAFSYRGAADSKVVRLDNSCEMCVD